MGNATINMGIGHYFRLPIPDSKPSSGKSESGFVLVVRVTQGDVARKVQIVARRRLLKFLILQKPFESR